MQTDSTIVVATQPAVIATCSRCGEKSNPMDPDKVPDWQKRHEEHHENEDRRERMENLGHKVDVTVEWVIEDDSKAHVTCSCGWRSRSAKTCWMGDFIDAHLKEAEAEIGETV